MVGDIAKKMDDIVNETSDFGVGPDEKPTQASSQVCTAPLEITRNPSLQGQPKNLNDIDFDITQDAEKIQS